MSGIIYLGSPYTHEDENIQHERFEQAILAAGYLINRNEYVFSPIAHSHPIQMACKLDGSFRYWAELDRRWISVCSYFYILQISGWKESVGLKEEFKIARELNKMICRMVPVDNEYEIITVGDEDLWTMNK